MSTSLISPSTSISSMTSKEIADLTGKRHDHVIRDIRNALDALYCGKNHTPNLGYEEIQGVTVKKNDRGNVAEISLDKSHTLTVTSGYSVVQRKRIIDRWLELESKQQRQLTPSEIILAQAQQLVELERKQAEQADRIARIEAKQKAFEKGINDFSVLAYCGYKGYPELKMDHAQRLGKAASKLCRESGLPIGKVRDPRFGYVNTYPETVLEEIFAGELQF